MGSDDLELFVLGQSFLGRVVYDSWDFVQFYGYGRKSLISWIWRDFRGNTGLRVRSKMTLATSSTQVGNLTAK